MEESENADEAQRKKQELEEAFQRRMKRDANGKDIRQQVFLLDPSEATKVFFSSFLYDKGLQ